MGAGRPADLGSSDRTLSGGLMGRDRKLLALLGLLVVAAAAIVYFRFGDVSGTYVAKYSNAARLVVLEQSWRGQITGRMISTELTKDGAIENWNAEFSGHLDGSTLNGTFTIAGVPILRPSFSGGATGDSLWLNTDAFGSNVLIAMKPSTAADYESHVKALYVKSRAIINDQKNKIVAQQNAAEQQQRIEIQKQKDAALATLRQQIESLPGHLVIASSRINDAVARHQAGTIRFQGATSKMQSYLDRQMSMRGDFRAEIAREQISIEIDRLNVALENERAKFTDESNVLIAEMRETSRRSVPFLQKCQALDLGQELARPCQDFIQIAEKFRVDGLAAVAGISKLNADLLKERSRQSEIVQLAKSHIK
jgi:hypothetical protein